MDWLLKRRQARTASSAHQETADTSTAQSPLCVLACVYTQASPHRQAVLSEVEGSWPLARAPGRKQVTHPSISKDITVVQSFRMITAELMDSRFFDPRPYLKTRDFHGEPKKAFEIGNLGFLFVNHRLVAEKAVVLPSFLDGVLSEL